MADASIGAGESVDGLHLIGSPATPLRDSLLWSLQSAFYSSLQIRAWSEAIVPNFVTSNAFIAHTYARVIMGFIRDWATKYVCALLPADTQYPSLPSTH